VWLVVGLGNPGNKYARNRHNIGFRVVDELVAKHALPAWKTGKGGETTTGFIARDKLALLKPTEFMNLSGFAVQRTANFLGVEPDHILVIHDEVDLGFGVVRLKSGGGHGGHNGLRSIIEQLGENGFQRVRVGVGRDPNLPPGKQADTAGWVLGDFPSAQATAVTAMIAAACEGVETTIAEGILPAMNQHNGRSIPGAS
jgi:peptidyl-tRNA hydrolase, PTH1 family